MLVRGILPAIQVHIFFYNNVEFILIRSMHIGLIVTYFRTVPHPYSHGSLQGSPGWQCLSKVPTIKTSAMLQDWRLCTSPTPWAFSCKGWFNWCHCSCSIFLHQSTQWSFIWCRYSRIPATIWQVNFICYLCTGKHNKILLLELMYLNMLETLILNHKFNDYSLNVKIWPNPFYTLSKNWKKKADNTPFPFIFIILFSRITDSVCNQEKLLCNIRFLYNMYLININGKMLFINKYFTHLEYAKWN